MVDKLTMCKPLYLVVWGLNGVVVRKNSREIIFTNFETRINKGFLRSPIIRPTHKIWYTPSFPLFHRGQDRARTSPGTGIITTNGLIATKRDNHAIPRPLDSHTF